MIPGERLARFLAALPPATARAIEAAAPDPSFEPLATPSGEPTARWRGVLLHSPRDPRREARELVAREAGEAPAAGVLLGLGLGYTAEAFRAAHPGAPLVVIEPDPGLARAAAETRDLAMLAADPSVRIVVGSGPSEAETAMEGLPAEGLAVLRLVAEIRRRPDAFRAAEGALRSFQLRREINANTLARFGRLWVRNLAANLGTFLAAPGVGELSGLFAGLPAVVLAGGPTLDDLMPLLPEIAKRAVLVSVNTPLAACLAAGVHPDVVTVVDPQFWASRYLDWTDRYRGWIVAEPSTCPRVLRRRTNRVFIASSLFPLGERLEEAVGAKGKLGAGGSVSTAAWDLARLMGARPIHAAGLDLSFPGMRTHCRGTFFAEARRAASGRTATLEGWAFATLRDIGLFPAPCAAGGTVPSDRRMLLYRWWFENQVLMHPGLPVSTLSDRGVAIAGMGPIRAREPARPARDPSRDRGGAARPGVPAGRGQAAGPSRCTSGPDNGDRRGVRRAGRHRVPCRRGHGRERPARPDHGPGRRSTKRDRRAGRGRPPAAGRFLALDRRVPAPGAHPGHRGRRGEADGSGGLAVGGRREHGAVPRHRRVGAVPGRPPAPGTADGRLSVSPQPSAPDGRS